jgi:prophage antirepressor-like protein
VRVFADKLNNPLFCVIDIINILNIGIQEKIYIDVKSDCQEHVDPEKYDIPFSNEKNKLRCVLINELGALRLIFSKSTEPALQLQMFFLDKMHQIKN